MRHEIRRISDKTYKKQTEKDNCPEAEFEYKQTSFINFFFTDETYQIEKKTPWHGQ